MKKIGMIFGVFDGLHAGHRHFISSAQAECEVLVVVVARSETAHELKGKKPKKTLEERMHDISTFNPALTVVAGDSEMGSWDVISKQKPDVVFLGYDQKEIASALPAGIPSVLISAHEPDTYKSSLIHREGTSP